ncbi:MAG: hypothetical protein RRX92_05415 [Lachnospiraceae bacterium]
MQVKRRSRQHNGTQYRDQMAAAVAVLLFGMILAFQFDYYYDLNDDMLMKDIIAGRFTGVPEGHNIQMLMPLGWLLSVLYHIVEWIPWYGLFFISCQLGCFYLIAARSLRYFDRIWSKVTALVIEGVLICSLFLYELIFLQYTVTAALVGATAAFLLYTTERNLSWKPFLLHNIGSILLVILAFWIRTEMLLLLFPLLCVVGLCRWAEEKKIFCKDNYIKYLSVIGAILLGMFLSLMIDRMAYSSTEWTDFKQLFDSRTEIYDFYGIPPYEENREFYQSIGVSESEVTLLENYNYGLSSHMNEQTFKEIATYAKEQSMQQMIPRERFQQSIKEYLTMLVTTKTQEPWEFPWNQLVLLMYLCLLMVAIYGKNKSFYWRLPLLFAVRSGLWLFLYYRGRIMPRVSHSLYFVECVVLCAWLLSLYADSKHRSDRRLRASFGIAACILCLFIGKELTFSIDRVAGESERRAAVNREYHALQTYCMERPEQFFLLDIYSTVAYSEQVFPKAPSARVKNNPQNQALNYDYLGGWACKSPLDKQKLQSYGLTTIDEAIWSPQTYIISHVKRPSQPTAWLSQYLSEQKQTAQIIQTDMIRNDETDAFYVYQVKHMGQ